MQCRFAYGSKHGGVDVQYGAVSITYLQGQKAPSHTEYNLTTSKNTKQRGGGRGENKDIGGKTVNNPCSISTAHSCLFFTCGCIKDVVMDKCFKPVVPGLDKIIRKCHLTPA